MVIDLLNILLFADKDGKIRKEPVRRFFSIIDGVIGGESNGPLAPESRKCGVLVAGFNPVAVDIAATRLMGFDCNKLRMISHVLDHPETFGIDVRDIFIYSNKSEFEKLLRLENRDVYFAFEPHPGWKGLIEISGKEHWDEAIKYSH